MRTIKFLLPMLFLIISCESEKPEPMMMSDYMAQFINERIIVEKDTFLIVNYDSGYETFDLYRNGKTIKVDRKVAEAQLVKPKYYKINQ